MKISRNRAKKFGVVKTQEIWRQCNGRCSYCGIKLHFPTKDGSDSDLDTAFTLDHKTPISKGGTNKRSNLIGCCRKCNGQRSSARLSYLRLRLISERDNWPKFSEEQYEFLLTRGIDLSKFSPYKFYYETVGVK